MAVQIISKNHVYPKITFCHNYLCIILFKTVCIFLLGAPNGLKYKGAKNTRNSKKNIQHKDDKS